MVYNWKFLEHENDVALSILFVRIRLDTVSMESEKSVFAAPFKFEAEFLMKTVLKTVNLQFFRSFNPLLLYYYRGQGVTDHRRTSTSF